MDSVSGSGNHAAERRSRRPRGSRWPGATAEQVVDQLAGAPGDLGSSILFDRVAGRSLEWAVRNGALCRLGARHGVSTPVSDMLVPLLAAASDDPH